MRSSETIKIFQSIQSGDRYLSSYLMYNYDVSFFFKYTYYQMLYKMRIEYYGIF